MLLRLTHVVKLVQGPRLQVYKNILISQNILRAQKLFPRSQLRTGSENKLPLECAEFEQQVPVELVVSCPVGYSSILF